MIKATLKEISEYISKDYTTVRRWNTLQPKLKEICILGMTCKKHNIDLPKLLQLLKTVDTLKDLESKK